MGAAFSVRVACATAWMMALMPTFGDETEGGVGGAWVAGTLGASAAKAGIEEARVEVCYREGRRDYSNEAGGNDVMSVGGGRLLGYWIRRSAA